METFSQYIRIYPFDVHVLVYNTINGEVIIFPKDSVSGNKIIGQLDARLKEYLYKHYFFDCVLPWNKFAERYNSNNRILISLETFLSCNLSCPYCYQTNNNHLKVKISKNNLDLLYKYIINIHHKTHFDIIVLKILGGEPSLDWSPAEYFLRKITPFCQSNSIKLDLRIDTNCTNIKPFITISGYNSILFTVPLCNKTQHNKYRHYRNGVGTYDDIIKNILTLENLPNSRIILRHNTDSHNIRTFNEYLNDIATSGIHNPIITPQYTTNPDYGEYENQLTYQGYVDWLSSECIDCLISHNFKANIYPRLMLDGKCQHWSSYSLKLFSDGKVGACAAHFFDNSNPYLSHIVNHGCDTIGLYWGGTKQFNLFQDEECLICPSLFGCAGHYKLPCIKELQLMPCAPEVNLYLNWQLYFTTIYKHIIAGKQKYLPGLNIKFIE